MIDLHGTWSRKQVRTGSLAVAALATVTVIAGSTWLAMAKSPPKKSDPAPAAQAVPETAAPVAATPVAAAPAAAAQVSPSAPPDIAAKLKENGAGACAPQIDALGAGTMGGTTGFNTLSKWATSSIDKRMVGVVVGQKYPGGSGVPYGATSVMAAPNAQGSCDAMAVQVLPSPLPCAKLRETLSAQGRQVAELADIPLMQDAAGETLLVPTAANTCVLVGLRTAYAK